MSYKKTIAIFCSIALSSHIPPEKKMKTACHGAIRNADEAALVRRSLGGGGMAREPRFLSLSGDEATAPSDPFRPGILTSFRQDGAAVMIPTIRAGSSLPAARLFFRRIRPSGRLWPSSVSE